MFGVPCGGVFTHNKVDKEAIADLKKLKSEIAKKADVCEFTTVRTASQVVNGYNMFAKIRVKPGKYLHVKYYKDFSGKLSLSYVHANKKIADGWF